MSFLQKQFGFSTVIFRRPEYDNLDALNMLGTPRVRNDPLQPHTLSIEPELQYLQRNANYYVQNDSNSSSYHHPTLPIPVHFDYKAKGSRAKLTISSLSSSTEGNEPGVDEVSWESLRRNFHQTLNSQEQQDQSSIREAREQYVSCTRRQLNAQKEKATSLEERREQRALASSLSQQIKDTAETAAASATFQNASGLETGRQGHVGGQAWRRSALWEGASMSCRRMLTEETASVLQVAH